MGDGRPNTPEPVVTLWRILNEASPTYLVGGAVRDMLAGREPKDYDLASALEPRQVMAICEAAGYRVIPNGEKFGTVTVLTDAGGVEVTTFRKDGRYTDSRHPDRVAFAQTIEEDLARRDFTMNAIAVDFDGNAIDPFDGRRDIGLKTIRVVGDPSERFKEDPLRMWRAVRFLAERKARDIASDTSTAMERYRVLTAQVSRERIRDELSRILLSPAPDMGLWWAQDTGLLSLAIPEWQSVIGYDQRNSHHAYTLDEHTLNVVNLLRPVLDLRLAGLLHDVAKPVCACVDWSETHYYDHEAVGARMAEEILMRLRYPKHVVDHVTLLVRHHMFPFEDAGAKAYRRLIARVGRDVADHLVELHTADVRASREDAETYEVPKDVLRMIDNADAETDGLRLAIDGYQVMGLLSVSPGPEVGRALRTCREAVLDNPEMNTTQDLARVVLGIHP